jgi:taurine--2-oxoglutarate transaminase
MSLPYYISWTKQNGAPTFEIETAKDSTITTTDGKKIIDMTSISYQAHFGHSPQAIINKIKSQLDHLPMTSPKGRFPLKDESTVRLLNYMQKPDGKIFYTTGGAETIENALKIARDFTKKKIVLARKNSYHGATMGALSVTGDWRNPPHQLPNDWVVRIPEPTEENSFLSILKIVEQVGPQNIAAIILETITGGNGVIIPSKEWLKSISDLCKKNNILLIMDEVVCGFMRTGLPFGYMHFEVEPDLICLAKGITGGMIPFGALWTSKEIADYYEENVLCCGLTNYAHPLGIAAMSGVLNIVESKDFNKNLKMRVDEFKAYLNDLKSLPIVKEVRQIGMLSAVDLNHSVDGKKFLLDGVYLVSQTNRIIIAPPLIINPDDLKNAMKIIFNVLKNN